eukprot:COSAG04_NODE_91_length_26852_cov_8.609315_37_plen_199_part_00
MGRRGARRGFGGGFHTANSSEQVGPREPGAEAKQFDIELDPLRLSFWSIDGPFDDWLPLAVGGFGVIYDVHNVSTSIIVAGRRFDRMVVKPPAEPVLTKEEKEEEQRRADAEHWPALARELDLEAGSDELQRTKTVHAKELAEKDKKLEEKDKALEEKDKMLDDKDRLLAEQAAELARLRTLSEGVPPEPEPEPEAAQ